MVASTTVKRGPTLDLQGCIKHRMPNKRQLSGDDKFSRNIAIIANVCVKVKTNDGR